MQEQESLNDVMHGYYEENYPSEVIEIVNRSIIEDQKSDVKGLLIGDEAPDFELRSTTGEKVKLSNLLKNGPVVLSFFRGSWCPYCNMELQALQKNYKTIRDLGAEVVTIHPQKMDDSIELANKYGFEFPILSDEGQDTISIYKIKFNVSEAVRNLYKDSFGLDLAKINANGQWNLPVPATFIIDTDGVIRSRYFSHDYMLRMEPADIIVALKNLPESTPEPYYERVVSDIE